MKEDGNYVLIPNGTKIKIISTDGNFSEVEGIDGTKYGWTSNGNYKKTDEADIFEIKDPDARLRVKKRVYTSTGKTLNAGDFIITKGIAENIEYTKIAQTEKINESYTENADSDGFVLTENLTGNWANVKGKNATWEKGKYTGQIDLVKVLGEGREMEYLKTDVKSTENDMFTKYKEMSDAAKSEGIIIELVDGFRTFPEQATLFKLYSDEKKKVKNGEMEEKDRKHNQAATPGWSKHQIGTAFDLNNKDADATNLNIWLMKNSYKYGFVRNLNKGREESHHWEYRPNETRGPKSVEKKEGDVKKNYTRYYFGSFSLNNDKDWETYKWWANCYDE